MASRNRQRRFQIFCLLLTLTCQERALCSAQSSSTPVNLPPAVLPQNTPPVAAQTSPPPASANGSAQTPEQEKKEEKAEKKEEKKEKKEKKKHAGSFVIAPIPIVSPALGSGVIPVVGYITPVPEREHGETPSVFGVAGLITNNSSRGIAVGADLYFKQSKYELTSGYAHGSLDYNLYGTGFANGNADLKLPLEQSGQAYFLKFLRRIPWNFYVGGRFFTGSSILIVKPASGNLPPIPPDVGLHTNLRSLGFEVWRDTRPNKFYPVKGTVFDFTSDFFGTALGSKYTFQSYKVTFNKYWTIPKKQVIAYNAFYCATGGNAPFYAQCIYGTNNELRGYTAGRYIDDFMLATQVEDRLELPWRFGIVGFAGVGAVTPGPSRFRSNQFLPAGGTGIRFLLSKPYHVNLRTDFAWGKDNFTWAVGVGEAF